MNTYGYIQFYVLGEPDSDEDKAAVLRAGLTGIDLDGKMPVKCTLVKTVRDSYGNITQRQRPKYVFGSEHTLDEMIETGRRECIEANMLGFSVHAADGTQLRELELTNLWAEGLAENETSF